MLEITLARRQTSAPQVYGPGPQTLLRGDTTYGYFGEVTEAEMGLNAEFKWILSNTEAELVTVDFVTNTWFKFIINGRILFFPKLPLAGKITSAELYAMKAVFSAKEAYKPTTQFPTGAAMYTQSLHVRNTQHLFLVRLMDGLPDAFQSTFTTATTPAATSEVARTIGALVTRTGAPDPLGIRSFDWRAFSYTEAGQYYYKGYVKEAGTSGGTTYEYAYGADTDQLVWEGTPKAWRPMLELIPADEQADLVFEAERFSIINEGLPQQAVLAPELTNELSVLTHFTNEVEAKAVVLAGESDAVYGLSLLGGVTTADNDFSNYLSSGESDYSLIEISVTSTSDMDGHLSSTSEDIYTPTDMVGIGDPSIDGYISTSSS